MPKDKETNCQCGRCYVSSLDFETGKCFRCRLPDNPELIEKTEDGEVVYVHAEECVGFCDYACNADGDRQAEILNENTSVEARQ